MKSNRITTLHHINKKTKAFNLKFDLTDKSHSYFK